jgi:hypothetical protein
VGLVITLTVLGLNVSNEAINQLTASQRPPVVALQIDSSQLEFHIAGQQYTVQGDKLEQAQNSIKTAYEKTINHFYRIWAIFKVVFLS